MPNANDYLGPNIKTGPGSYVMLNPVTIFAKDNPESYFGKSDGFGGKAPTNYAGSPDGFEVTIQVRQRLNNTFGPLIKKARLEQEDNYKVRFGVIDKAVESDIVEASGNYVASSPESINDIKYKVSIIEGLIGGKRNQAQSQLAISNGFYHREFFAADQTSFFQELIGRWGTGVSTPDESFNEWLKSLSAAYWNIFINDEISYLNSQLAQAKTALDKEQAKQASEWAAVAAWAQRYNARKDPIINQYNTNKAKVEQDVQSKLDSVSATVSMPLATPADWISKAIKVVDQSLKDVRGELAAQNSVLANYPGLDFRNRDLKDFLERSRDNKLDPEVAFEQELAAIRAAYQADVLRDKIKSLEDRLPKLDAAKLAQDAEAKAKADVEMKDALKFTADFYKEVTAKFGERASTLAKELAENSKGKKVRNAQEALKAYDQYKGNLNKKFSVKDRQAIANAMEGLNKDMMAKSLTKFSKGFGTVGDVMDFVDLATEAKKSVQNDNWAPFFLKAETIIVGKGATAAVAFMFGMTAATPIGILGFALLMAVTSSLVDDALVGKINSYIMSL
ncbi:colicin-like pore-forming protein [Pseudomonas chlororaphis]|uniref:colicin-like pore-forming protein n=1 Tax=Pseudomonas chlororaphis TaxID=587753 RepID=UPI001473B525|nr:colicin-like pore-forming protein [Pseudomonas chlororaphis]NNB42281.1 hypothetical protein [Pseudomonas chlororaphis]